MQSRSQVTVIGLGNMGFAIARALLRSGHQVVVWNRTPSRAAPLVDAGARLAHSPEEAVAASPLTIMCVLDYAAANEVLRAQGVKDALPGRCLVQTTSGVPEEVAGQCEVVRRNGAEFLSGGIMVFPSAIGRTDAAVVYSGSGDAYARHAEVLASVAGSSVYLGADPVLAVGAYCTAGIFALGTIGLFLETATLARHYGIPIDAYYDIACTAADVARERIRESTDRIAGDRYLGDEAAIDMVLMAMRSFSQSFESAGFPALMTNAFCAQLELASANGGGSHDLAYLARLFWDARRSGPPDRGSEC